MSRLIFPLAFAATTALSATVFSADADDAASRPPQAAPPALLKVASAERKPQQFPAGVTPTPQQLYLIRATLIALHDANRTGNYTVLRDGAAPQFQARYSAADLAIAFAKVRGTLDLAPAAVGTLRLSKPALVTPQRSLLLAGLVGAERDTIRFEMEFEAVAGHWRLAALAVGK